MAELGRRDVVGDPLALNPASQPAQRDLATMGVRNPGQTGGNAVYEDQMNAIGMLGELGNALTGVLKAKEEDWQTEGQLAYMQGKTEEEIAATGNKWTMQGWQALNTVDAANRFYADELVGIQNGGRSMSPEQYGKLLMEKRAAYMQDLPEDPAIRKLYVAAFDDVGPRLTAQQVASHNEWNQEQTGIQFANVLQSGSYTNSDAPTYSAQTPLALSPGVVRTTVQGYNDTDVDQLTRIMLAEAGSEGPTGLAAVAHVILNRTIDGGYGGRSLSAVIMQPGAFSPANSTTGHAGGEQGQDLGKWDANSAAYQNARNIALDVLSGHNVDPTNGRTHFWSGETPYWADSEGAKGAPVKIGGHTFVGAARNLGVGTSTSTGALKFANPGEEDIDPQFATVLSNSALQLGIDLNINSGHRSEEHNKAVGGADESRHVEGDAVDIDMSGMNDEERANLVRTLRANGASRFSTYSTTNHLHVDMAPPVAGANWFMHDETNGKLGNAPEWFKAVAAEPPAANGTAVAATGDSSAQGVADGMNIPTAGTVSIAQTQMQDTIRGFNMPMPQKAAYVTQELVTQLSMGSTQLWDSVGGVAFLGELGATPQQVRQVNAAHEAYKKDELGKFNIERTKWSEQLGQDVLNGTLTADEAYEQITQKYEDGFIGDQLATSLVGQIVTAENNAAKPWVLNPDFQERLGSIYANLRNDPYTFGAAYSQAQIELLGAEYGASKEELQDYIVKVWNLQDQERAQLDNQVATQAAKAAVETAKMDEAKAALTSGYGLSGLSGEIGGVPAKQWAINYRRQQLAQASQPAIEGYMGTGMTQQEAVAKADAEIDGILWSELYRQGVVDTELQGKMQAAVSGNLVGADGTVYPDVEAAFDVFLRMRNTPGVGPAYAAKYFGDNEDARTKMMLAESLFSGGLDISTALRKASELTANGAEPPNIRQTENFTRNLNSALSDNFDRLLGDTGWGTQSSIKPEELEAAKANSGQLKAAIERRAMAYFASESQIDPQVLIKKAAEDVINQSTIVGGNLLLPRDAHSDTFMQQLAIVEPNAVNRYDADTPNQVIRTFLTELATDFGTSMDPMEKSWLDAWKRNQESYGDYGVSLMGQRPGAALFAGNTGPDRDPPFHITWDQDAGSVTISLWENAERKRTLGVDDNVPARTFSLKEIGAWYKDQNKPTPNELQNAWNSIWDFQQSGGLKQPSAGAQAGEVIGERVIEPFPGN